MSYANNPHLPLERFPRLPISEAVLTQELRTGPAVEIPDNLRARVEGEAPGIWGELEAFFEELSREPNWVMDQRGAIELHRKLRMTPRTATDMAIWHYATLFHARPLAFTRWPLDKETGLLTVERLLGGPRRNTLARLWWMGEALNSDGSCPPELLEIGCGSTERFKLWLIDFNSFHGRAWLARAVTVHLHKTGKPKDAEVRAFFVAMGKLANVIQFDVCREEPQRLLDAVDEAVAATNPEPAK